tara:strand:- start:1914 stop:2756 length:843 start_codon:yes stop_codon:yes gene_type:complete
MNCQKALYNAKRILGYKSTKSPILDSEILLSFLLKIERNQLLINLDQIIKKNDYEKFIKLILRRKKGEPIAYIIGFKEFWKNKYFVNSDVLIPRPDSEVIVEESLKLIPKKAFFNILDVGTGSGCIILSILKERKNCFGVGIDISLKALKVAKINAKMQQINNRIKFINSDIDKFCFGKYDIILSNPPYINSFGINYLENDIKNYEPKVALDGGIEGLSCIEKLIKKSPKLIKKKGKLFIEIGSNQLNKTKRLLYKKKFYINKIAKDLGNNDRCVLSTKH